MSPRDTMKPTGRVPLRRVVQKPDPNEHLLERILSRAYMRQAWKRVKANAGAPGVDHMAVDKFSAWAKDHWAEIRHRLQTGTYRPLPVKRVEISKPAGGMRPLGIPAVVDRLIQQAIAQALMPIFDPGFSQHSYGFSGPAGLPTMPCIKSKPMSKKAIAVPWTWTLKSSSIRSTTICSCTG